MKDTAWAEAHPTNDTDASQENKIGTNEANLVDTGIDHVEKHGLKSVLH